MDINKGWLERREFERVKDVLKVVYYPIDNKETIMKSDDYKDTTLENLKLNPGKNPVVNAITDDISKGGLAILTDKPLALGQLVIIDLFLPRLAKPIKLLTEVRNIESYVKGSGSFRAGLKIISVSKSDLQRIENYILEIKQKGGKNV
jgi:c-di-GMP-binding flagellar brake protein YcgR